MNDEPSIAVAMTAALVLLGVAAALWATRVFSERAFVDSPQRRGSLGIVDIAISLGVLLVGSVIGANVIEVLVGETDDEQTRMLVGMWGMYLGGGVPAVGYLLYRTRFAVEGGVAGFGFGLGGAAGRTLKATTLGVLAIFATTFATMLLVGQLAAFAGHPPPQVAHETLRVLQEAPGTPAAIALMAGAVIAAPFLEEIFFRGLIHTALRNTGLFNSRWLVIGIASVLFLLVHVPVVLWQAMPALFVLSLGLGYLYERTGSLWPPIFVHALFNAVQLTFALQMGE